MTAGLTHKLPVQDIIEWDVLNWSQLIEYWQPIIETLPANSRVLAIGERNGGLSLWLALQGFDVVCTDIKETTDKAKALHKQYNVAHKIQYKTFDVINDTLEAEQYDVVIAKSVIGGLKTVRTDAATRSFDTQQKAVDHIHRLLKPGGYFFSAENLQGGFITRTIRSLTNKNNGWRHLSIHEIKTLFRAFTLVETKTFGILPTFFSGGIRNRCMFFINKNLLSFMPASSKYIAFTIAQK